MFRVVPPPIIRSTNNCIYSIWFLSHRYCYLLLTVVGSSNGVTNTSFCMCSCLRSWWRVVVPPETCRAVSRWNKLCNVASCWIYIRIFLWCMDPWMLNSDCGLLGDDIVYFCRRLPTSLREEFLLHVWTQHFWNIGNHLWNKAKENVLEIIG